MPGCGRSIAHTVELQAMVHAMGKGVEVGGLGLRFEALHVIC